LVFTEKNDVSAQVGTPIVFASTTTQQLLILPPPRQSGCGRMICNARLAVGLVCNRVRPGRQEEKGGDWLPPA
jgi:hypothetical protein